MAWTGRFARCEITGRCLPDAAACACPRIRRFRRQRRSPSRSDHSRERHRPRRRIQEPGGAEPADIDQVLGYAQELADYHAVMPRTSLIPVLIPIGLDREPYEQRGVHVVPPRDWAHSFEKLAKGNGSERGCARVGERALRAIARAYAGARLLSSASPLPQIKRAESAKIPEASPSSKSDSRRSTRGGPPTRNVTGVPGSGKDPARLQVAHSSRLAVPTISCRVTARSYNVLKYSLGRGAHAFVQDMRAFLKQHGGSKGPAPPSVSSSSTKAQRAWDRDRVLQRHHPTRASEPETAGAIGNRLSRMGSLLIVLIGEGAGDYTGEESGIGQWAAPSRAERAGT